MALKTIRLDLARSPEFPEGSADHRYEFTAPLDPRGHIDLEGWKANRSRCTVRRFWGGEESRGHLVYRRDRQWAFHYNPDEPVEEEEPGYRFESHAFRPGEYVSITEADGVTRTFKVVSVR
ncbi:MAG: hypothetical protein ACOY3L_03505 [Pseudomonadota bacterium]